MAVWAFGRLNHLPQLGLMQELANQAMLNSKRLTTKVSTLDAVALSQHNAPNLLSAVLLTCCLGTSEGMQAAASWVAGLRNRSSLVLLTHQFYLRNACCPPDYIMLLAMFCSLD